MLRRIALILALLASPASICFGQYRAFWIDAFHTNLGTRQELDRIVNSAVERNANAIFVQVRRRGDSWYLESKEPLTEVPGVGEPDATGLWTIDPLQYLIDRAHARHIEVHAFTIVGAIYRDDPQFALPKDPSHVFLQHFWNPATNAPYTGRRQWATRVLPHNAKGTSYDGQRLDYDWYVDLGNPDAAAYTLDVLTHLVENYDVDGIHLDRIRYPEAPMDHGGGANVGYNETSVERFKAQYGSRATYYKKGDPGITAGDVGYPKTNDPLWNAWRREQVTNFVRRLYLSVKSIKPWVKVSAALICYADGPKTSGGFNATEAYTRVFQDWRGWSQEGIIDLLAPMDYKKERLPQQARQFDDWMEFTASTAREYGRIAVIGVGAFMNGVDSARQQAQRAFQNADGVLFYALASTQASFDEARFVPAPNLRATTGHLAGFLRDSDGATITIENLDSGVKRTAHTDGNGFFGAVGLEPGRYVASAGEKTSCVVTVGSGRVAWVELSDVACRGASSTLHW